MSGEGKNHNKVPDEIRKSWGDEPADEREQLERTWQIAGQVRGDEPDEATLASAEQRLLQAIETAGERPRSGRRPSRRALRGFTVAASGLAAVAVLLHLALDRPKPQDPGTSSTMEYMLLLHGEPLVRYPAEEHGRIIGEYAAWANELSRSGRLIAGNELAMGGRILSVGQEGVVDREIEQVDLAVSGYFIIAAASMDEAARIAADCPHLKYRGTVEIRKIGA